MSKSEPISRRDRYGGSDVVRGYPKPTAAGHWKKSVRAARLYADQWARAWAHTQWDYCVTCGSRINLQWAHVSSGRSDGNSVRWEKKNMTIQCEPCNHLHEHEPEHLIAWFLENYGQPALFALTVQSNRVVKYTYSEIMAIGDKYREAISGKT